ncbi:MAG TPA: SLBB domain-containing protein, partial [Armatimonadota bacterium]|nr:SLBB domain-containing protein [Armatimonadota bacterium]
MTRFLFVIWCALLSLAVQPVIAQEQSAVPPASAIIAAGDVLTVTVVGEPDLTLRVTVANDGKILMPLAGEVKLAGLKPAQAAALLRKLLSRYLRDPAVSIDMVEANRASVYGRVTRAGSFTLPARARVNDLIAMAGGFTERADRANIRLLRDGNESVVNLEQFIATGDSNFNPEVQPGDVLNVPEQATITISVLGQVLRPGMIVAPVDSRVADAIQMAGGFTEHAQRERVTVLRGTEQIVVDLSGIMKDNKGANNPLIRPGDTITVPEKRLMSISVLGQVVKPSVYEVPEATTVAEVLILAGGVVPGSDLTLARLIHRDQRSEPINLREALENADASANVTLQDGDTIAIPKPIIERRFGVLGAVGAGGSFLMDRDEVSVVEALARA